MDSMFSAGLGDWSKSSDVRETKLGDLQHPSTSLSNSLSPSLFFGSRLLISLAIGGCCQKNILWMVTSGHYTGADSLAVENDQEEF